jgi:hypothetical protein
MFAANQKDFLPIIYDLNWFRTRMEEVYMARNNVAHCLTLAEVDNARIRVFHRDWAQLLDTKGIA